MPSEPLDFMEALDALSLPKVTQKPWMPKTHMERVTADTLNRVVDECIAAGMYGFDIETTGLDNRVFYADDGSPYTVDKTVGVCLAPSEDKGYYIPIRHRDPKTGSMAAANVPLRLVVPALQRLVNSPARAVFHNAKFDQEFLQHEVMGGVGEWDDPDKWDDTFILAYMRDTRERNKGLKHLSHVELQREMIELEELFTPEEVKAGGLNFGNLDPTWEPAVWYACSDAMCTLGLRRVLYPKVTDPDEHKNEQRTLYKIEKSCVSATRWMERCRIPIDRDKVGELIRIGQREWFACLVEVYVEVNKALDRDTRPKWMLVMQEHPTLRFDPESVEPSYMDARETAMAHAGEEDNRTTEKSVPSLTDPRKQETVAFPVTYDVTIPEQLGLLMRELGVRGLRATEKSGQVKTSKDELERVIEEAGDEYPFMGKIRRFREVAKALSSNLFPIWFDTSPERSPDGRIRVSFNAHKVDTGRFSTPTPRDEARFTGQVRWNLHSIPATYDKKKPECMRRMREIIRVADDKVLYAIDYSGVELRIVTNLSGEPKWVEEFFRCSECDTKFDKGQGAKPPPHFCPKCGSDKIGDLHTLTALAIYGDAAKDAPDFKQKRQSSKCVHPDTLINTAQGRVCIGGLDFGGADTFCPVSGVEVLNPAQQYVPVKETYNGGVKPLYHVVTRRGVLTCSGVHRFALADGTLKSVDAGLVPGDMLPEPSGGVEHDREFPVVVYRPFEGVPPLSYQTTTDTAYFAGLHAGDGCSSEACAEIAHGDVSKTDPLGVPYAEWQKLILAACVAVGLEPRAKQRRVYLGSRHVLRWMQALEMVKGNPPTKRTFRVPAWVLKAGRLAMLHYLGGLVDTDGCVSAGGDLSVTTKDFVFAGQIAELFRAVGCVAAVAPSWNKTYERYYLKVSVKRKDGATLRPFMRHLGKKARIGDTPVEYKRWGNEVLLVLPAGEGPCVDLHVDSEDHLYAANGLAVHNSLNFAMCYGGGGSAAQRAVGVDKEEGWRIKNQFDKSYMGLRRWWGKQHDTARRWTYVRTAFGRKYPLPDILHTDGGFRSKAERNAVNGPVQGCLHPEVMVPTREGLYSVRDLYLRGSGFEVWTGQGWAPARPLYSGEKQVRVTTFTSGTDIKTSPKHLFLAWDTQTASPQGLGDVLRWVRQEDLQDGTWVATSTEPLAWPEPHYKWAHEERPQEGHLFTKGMTPHNYKGFSIDGNSELLWEFLGLIYGDGSITKDRFDLHVGTHLPNGAGVTAEAWVNAYAENLNATLGVGAYVTKNDKGEGRNPVWVLKVCNKAFRDFCREVLGVVDQNTYTKRFPSAVWREGARNRAAFLRGYFSADGHVSASGDAVSVRSVNHGLLRDAHALLRSLGVRSACRERSLRVSVLDRATYEQVVGFCVPHKAERLAARHPNPWVHQWDMAPPDLVRWVGETVYTSSVYAGLSRAQKSAVLRLKCGSGSRPQCVSYLDKVPVLEVPEELRRLLRYGWEQVTVTHTTDDTVEMYDVEVLDDVHAFVADGVVVHNTSADIMKLAMVLIYREFKKRGWLRRAKAIVTIHDELVFEVDGDIAEEMVDVTVPLMVEKTVAPLGWLVPLKVDIEFGQNWLVPLNLIELEHGKKPWPEKWARMFPRRSSGHTLAVTAPPVAPEPQAIAAPPPVAVAAPPVAVAAPPVAVAAPPVAAPPVAVADVVAQTPGTTVEGGRCVHVIHTSRLSLGLMDKLARVIQRCEGRGTTPLRIVTETGEVLLDEVAMKTRVAPGEFKAIAMYEGI